MNIEEFLAPISPEKPCGDNLEYDADFQAMGQASRVKRNSSSATRSFPPSPLTGIR
ncbi:type VI secretion system protein ImpA [Enterobacter cloacae]|uniref:Type VI secretion system protein ImpA n=1 Tax=Enterobacter cloacae TaxID=550 RepID=A0A377LYU0_ENTCL|nr:type VI secretion system protein ImpA [Enterobacter cloacae]